MQIAVIGNGSVSQKLSALAKSAQIEVIVGARNPNTLSEGVKETSIPMAIDFGSVVVLAIPFLACADLLPPLADKLEGKIVIDATNPLNPDWSPATIASGKSGAEEIAALLPKSKVVKAFNSIFADIMTSERQIRAKGTATAFIAGDDQAAIKTVVDFAELIGFAPLYVGPLPLAKYLEGMAHLNIAIAIGQQGGTDAAFLYDQVKAVSH
jgi:8-hydroxy-5-deazaflavin:NADPH oxidoreductase